MHLYLHCPVGIHSGNNSRLSVYNDIVAHRHLHLCSVGNCSLHALDHLGYSTLAHAFYHVTAHCVCVCLAQHLIYCCMRDRLCCAILVTQPYVLSLVGVALDDICRLALGGQHLYHAAQFLVHVGIKLLGSFIYDGIHLFLVGKQQAFIALCAGQVCFCHCLGLLIQLASTDSLQLLGSTLTILQEPLFHIGTFQMPCQLVVALVHLFHYIHLLLGSLCGNAFALGCLYVLLCWCLLLFLVGFLCGGIHAHHLDVVGHVCCCCTHLFSGKFLVLVLADFCHQTLVELFHLFVSVRL